MKKNTVGFVLLALFILAFEINAQESPQTFVNPMTGKDVDESNQPNQQPKLKKSCSDKSNPCKTIAFSLEQTKNGGTITLLYADALNDEATNTCEHPYDNKILIIKSITIEAEKGLQGKPCILVTGKYEGIDINKFGDQNSKVKVKLKGIRFYGVNEASNGVSFFAGSQLTVDSCNFYGIYHAISFDAGKLYVNNSTFTHIGKAIFLRSDSGKVKNALIENSRFADIGNGSLIIEKDGFAVMKNNTFVR